jgi:hypothetical protein
MNEREIITYVNNIIKNSSKEDIDKIYDKYVLVSLDKNKLFNDCPIHEIMKSDLVDLNSIDVDKLYAELRLKYADDIINKIILQNEDHIVRKIKDVLTFTFEKIYHDSDIIKIIIDDYRDISLCSIPDIIYSTVLASSNLLSQTIVNNRFELKISKRI